MNLQKTIKPWIFFFIICFSFSCKSFKPTSSKGAGGLFETFFIGDEGTQYFIKALDFSNSDKDILEMDFTFRYKKVMSDSTIVNLSILANKNIKEIDKIRIHSDKMFYDLNEIELLYNGRKKKLISSRFSSKAESEEVRKFFKLNNWSIDVHSGQEILKFESTKSTEKKIDKLNYAIFDLF